MTIQEKIIDEILRERGYQDKKFGLAHFPGIWFKLVQEELNEARQAYENGDYEDYISELIQAAAVIVAWVEIESDVSGLDIKSIIARKKSDKVADEKTE